MEARRRAKNTKKGMSWLNIAETWTHQCEIRIWGTLQKFDVVKNAQKEVTI